jgi:hypothetical protein
VNGAINAAVAAAQRCDLQRAAGCCTALPEHRRALTAAIGRRLRFSLRGMVRAEPPPVCCT